MLVRPTLPRRIRLRQPLATLVALIERSREPSVRLLHEPVPLVRASSMPCLARHWVVVRRRAAELYLQQLVEPIGQRTE